jgi:hypothetical protein
MRAYFGWSIIAASAALLVQPARGQQTDWKAIDCIVEAAGFMNGMVLKIDFSETGRTRTNGNEYPATVTATENKFCRPADEKGQACYSISRRSGEFSLLRGTEKNSGGCVKGER